VLKIIIFFLRPNGEITSNARARSNSPGTLGGRRRRSASTSCLTMTRSPALLGPHRAAEAVGRKVRSTSSALASSTLIQDVSVSS